MDVFVGKPSVGQFCKMPFTLLVWIAVALNSGSLCAGSSLLRDTRNGRVRGFESEARPGKIVEKYLGIPYAKAPVGVLRLERPEPPINWTGVRNVTSLPPACPQSGDDYQYIQYHYSGNYSTGEDCLFINIYIPQQVMRRSPDGIPVFVWVHGGSNEVGMGAMLPGEVLAAIGEIIVINVNYRLDILGFLTFEDEDLPGNLGVLDIVAALEWIKVNIQAFGGDPRKVTVAGHSAGALNVGILTISPLAKGLFSRAVLQSGSAISFWSTMTDIWRTRYRKNIRKFLKLLNCNYSASKDIKNCLKDKRVAEIQTTDLQRVSGYPIQHPVVVDGYLVPSEPLHMLQNNHTHVTSVMMGFTKDEGVQLLGYQAYSSSGQGSRMNLGFLKTFVRGHYFEGPETNVDVIMHEYVHWDDPSNSCKLIRSCAEMFGDRGFSAPLHRTAEYISRHNPGSVYIYTFEHDLSTYTKECDNFQGVPHGEDIFYLFGVPIIHNPHNNMSPDPNMRNKTYVDKDRAMSKALMETWANFVKFGKPTHPVLNRNPESFNVETKPYTRFYTKNKQKVAIETSYDYKPRKMAFWNRLMVEREQLERECAVSGHGHIYARHTALTTIVSLILTCLWCDSARVFSGM